MVLMSILMSASGSGAPGRCVDLEALSTTNPDQRMPCPVFSGPGSKDEKCGDPKSVGGRSVDPAARLRLLALGDWNFPVTAPVQRL